MTHTAKECLERPRKVGAKWSKRQEDIAADDRVESVPTASWDAKRDRWNGFEADDYHAVVDR